MHNSLLEQYWEILQNSGDCIKSGKRKPHISLKRAGYRGQPKPQAARSSFALQEPDRRKELDDLAQAVLECRSCRLCEQRKRPVPGEGVLDPKVMIIGEAPGAQEDASGKPFVGPAGKYLDNWMKAIGLSRERDLFIGNIIKCRPPSNRDPLPDESLACRAFLDRQIELLQPRVILTLGRISMQLLLETSDGIGKRHGKLAKYAGIPLVPTYHPSGVLRNPQYRLPVWEDLKALKRLIGDDA